MAEAQKGGKLIHRTASPFATPNVAKLNQPHHDVVVNLLVSLLRSIAAHEAASKSSKGKRSRKRKRTATEAKAARTDAPSKPTPELVTPDDQLEAPPENVPSPATPSISLPIRKHVLLGFNEVTRHLEALSAHFKQPAETKTPGGRVAAVFLLRALDDLIYSHLPTLCHTASKASPEKPATRLVVLDTRAESDIAEALGKPARVSVLAVLDASDDEAPGLAEVVAYVRENVEPVEVPWLRDTMAGKWLSTKIESL